MKNCPLLVILIFSVVLTLTGIITSAVHHAAPQDYSRFQNQEADHLLTDASRMQSDELEFFSCNYETVGNAQPFQRNTSHTVGSYGISAEAKLLSCQQRVLSHKLHSTDKLPSAFADLAFTAP